MSWKKDAVVIMMAMMAAVVSCGYFCDGSSGSNCQVLGIKLRNWDQDRDHVEGINPLDAGVKGPEAF